jgi:actin related protein 2/3 complex subunit 2
MIILELANRIVYEIILQRLKSDKPYGVEMKCCDFDGVMFHVSTNPDNKELLSVSVGFSSAPDCLKNGGTDRIKTIYGKAVVAPEQGYNVTLQYDLTSVTKDKHEEFTRNVSMVKSHLFAAPFHHGIKAAVGTFIDMPYRSTDERLWVKKDANDRVTVIFSICFKDPDDVVIGTVFLKEFKKSIGGAPTVDFTNVDPPLELKGKTLPRAKNVGYVTFVLFDRHIQESNVNRTVDSLQTFRNYLHYHIKCAKSHLHTCMRNRVELLLKVLNRAKQDLPKEKKTIKGRTFNRKT